MINFGLGLGEFIAMLMPAGYVVDWVSNYEIYFWRLVVAVCIQLSWRVYVRARFPKVDSYDNFIPVIIPLWATPSVSTLWYITMLAQPREDGLGLIRSFFTLQVANVFLSSVISRIPKLSLLCHDILQSLTSRRSYNYQALPDEAHIRLVRLQGFLFWRRFQILSYPLDKCPPFDAISYTWDGQDQTSCVIVNGLRLLVTRNARQILNDFTPTLGHRMIWIDSICINQGQDTNSLEEKKIQVGRMSDIYRRAARVRVWLSKTSMLEPPFPELLHFKPRQTADMFAQVLERFLCRFFSPPTLSSRALELLLSHNYWTRVWVVQEIASGREVLIHFGSICVSWKSISAFATKLWSNHPQDRYCGPAVELFYNEFYNIQLSRAVFHGLRQIALITSLRRDTLNGDYQTMLSLLVLLVGTQASDPRDKIYGISSLAQGAKNTPDISNKILADYTLPTRKLYLRFTRTSLSQDTGNFDGRVLMYAGIGWPRTLSGLPSWVPDWTSVPETHLCGFTSDYFLWSRGLKMQPISFSGDRLKISGSRIMDSISAQTRHIDHDDTSRRWFHEICDVVGRQLDQIPRADIDLTGRSSRCYRRCPGRWRGAIYRVLVGDIVSYWGEVPEDTGVTTFVRPDSFSPDVPGAGYRHPGRDASPRRANLEHSYNKWLLLPHLQDKRPETAKKVLVECSQFTTVCRQQTQGLKFAITRTGRMCLVPPGAEVGDELIVFGVTDVPYLIRPIRYGTRSGKDESARRYWLVGHCFALGMMGSGGRDPYLSWVPNPEGYDPLVCKKQDIIIQ